MKQDALAHLFAKIGDAPECVARLRQIVVALAITGKLGLVDSASNPSDILAKVEEVKTRLAALRAIPKPKKPAPVTEEDLPASLQDATRFAALGTVARIEKGLTGIKDAPSGSFPLVVTAAERGNCDHFDFDGAAAIIPLVSSTGHGHASINRLHYQDGKFALGSILAAVLPYDPAQVSARFLFEYLSAFKEELLVARMTGSANVTLSIGRIAEIPVPLVCPAVQRTVDELMALCDRLEDARKEREAARDRLTAASLARLNAPDPDPATFTTHARFALNSLPALTTRADQIKQLRQTILRLGLAGKLTEQVAPEESAAELLERISQQRAKHLIAGYPNAKEAGTQLRKQAEQVLPCPLPAIPLGWEWATLQQCALLIIDCKNKTAPYSTAGIRLIRTTNVRDGKINSIDQKYVTPETYEAWSLRAKPIPGDILITREAPMGEVCIVPADEVICLGQRMMLARLVPDTIDPAFMLYSLRDPDLMERVQDKPIGMTVQHLRVGGVETLLVALPPLTEQRRIVAKLDELMTLCDRLETCLMTGDQTRQRLLEAILHDALEPAEVRELELA